MTYKETEAQMPKKLDQGHIACRRTGTKTQSYTAKSNSLIETVEITNLYISQVWIDINE